MLIVTTAYPTKVIGGSSVDNSVGSFVRADAVGLVGNFSSTAGPTEYIPVSLNHNSGKVLLSLQRAYFTDDLSNENLLNGSFVGPLNNFNAELEIATELSADFRGLIGKSDAVLSVGRKIESASFVGPIGSFSAVLQVEVPLEAEADGFVGPIGYTSANLVFFSAEAGFVGPRGATDALLFGDGAITGAFVGPMGYTETELKNILELSGSFEGIMGGGCAQLGVDDRTVWFDFVGPMGYSETQLKNALGVTASFVGPRGHFDVQAEAPVPMEANFIGIIGQGDAYLADDQLRMDALFRGPSSHMDAELVLNYPATEATMNFVYKKYGATIVADNEVNSTLTFFLVQA